MVYTCVMEGLVTIDHCSDGIACVGFARTPDGVRVRPLVRGDELSDSPASCATRSSFFVRSSQVYRLDLIDPTDI